MARDTARFRSGVRRANPHSHSAFGTKHPDSTRVVSIRQESADNWSVGDIAAVSESLCGRDEPDAVFSSKHLRRIFSTAATMTSQLFRRRVCEIVSYLSAMTLLLFVVSPPLVPLTISGVRAIANSKRTYKQPRAAVGRQGRALAASG